MKNEVEVSITIDDELKRLMKSFTCGSSTYIGIDSPESLDIEVFYKGKKVCNVDMIRLNRAGFVFEDGAEIVTNWKQRILGK